MNTSETFFQSWQEREAFELGDRAARVTVWTIAREMEFEQRYAELLDSAEDAALEAAIAWAYDRGAEAGQAQMAAQEIAEARGVPADPWGDGVAGFELPDAR